MRHGHLVGDEIIMGDHLTITQLPPGAVTQFNPDWDTVFALLPRHRKIVSGEVVARTAGEQTTADDIPGVLNALKTAKGLEVIANTEALMTLNGFTFNGSKFAIDATARDYWLTLRHAIADGTLSLPFDISKLKGQVFSLTTTDWDDFFAAFVNALKAYVDAENLLRALIVGAATKAALDLVVDTRT